MFTKNKSIKIKREIDRKFNLYYRCVDCSFKKFATIDEEKLSYLSKGLI